LHQHRVGTVGPDDDVLLPGLGDRQQQSADKSLLAPLLSIPEDSQAK
jgi:hypothetical protein